MMKAAIFDLDGTILDSMDIWYDAASRYLRSIGTEPEEDLGSIIFTMTVEEAAAYAREHYGLCQTEQEITEGVLNILRNFYYEEVQPKEGAPAFLRMLCDQGVSMAAATAGNRELAEAALRRLGLWNYFRGLLTCTEVGHGKHEPHIFLEALDLLGTNPEETCVFEDALYALKTAKGIGCRTVGVKDEGSLKDQEQIRAVSDSYIESWEEALICLERMEKDENSTDDCRQ